MPTDTRKWVCPECGKTVELSIFQLDPLACEECLAKREQKSPEASAVEAVRTMPDFVKLAGALLVGLVLGLGVGFAAGRLTAPKAPLEARSETPRKSTTTASKADSEPDGDASKADASADDGPDESTRPGTNYKWVRGYTRKDGVKVKGHWAKDPKK